MFDILIGLLIAASFYLIGQIELFRKKDEEIGRLRRQLKAYERAQVIAEVENQKRLELIQDLTERIEKGPTVLSPGPSEKTETRSPEEKSPSAAERDNPLS